MRSFLATSTMALGLLFGLTACPKAPEYPACKKAKHCEDGEPCVDGLCQACQADTDCAGKGPDGGDLACVNFRCEDPAAAGGECQGASDCDPGMICAAGACGFCTAADQCDSGVCNDSGRCEALPCATDDECPVDEICDGGQCLYNPLDGGDGDGVCNIAALYFGFDSATLSPNNQEQLSAAAACLGDLLGGGSTLVLEAHADNVGTEEYNILLTDQRGSTVREFLVGLGLPADNMRVVGKGALEAQGGDEATRTKDRRVTFIVE